MFFPEEREQTRQPATTLNTPTRTNRRADDRKSPRVSVRRATAGLWQTVLHGAENGVGRLLPLRGALTKPAVVGQVQEQICVVIRALARQTGNDVLETNQRRESRTGPEEFKRHRLFARGEIAGN